MPERREEDVMKHHEYLTTYNLWRAAKIGGADRLSVRDWQDGAEQQLNDIQAVAQLRMENNWMSDGRPYYSVFPVVTEALSRVKLDLPCHLVRLPLPELLIRFADGHEPRAGESHIRSFLMGEVEIRGGAERGMSIYADLGERAAMPDGTPFPILSYLTISLGGQHSVEEEFCKLDGVETIADRSELIQALRFAVAICLLGNDPDMIEPDVLARDRAAWNRQPTDAIVERAHRRGKKGWLIGSRISVAPHYRRPHFGIRWTGQGRRVPRIVPIKGAVIHRGRLEQIPTGRIDTPE